MMILMHCNRVKLIFDSFDDRFTEGPSRVDVNRYTLLFRFAFLSINAYTTGPGSVCILANSRNLRECIHCRALYVCSSRSSPGSLVD